MAIQSMADLIKAFDKTDNRQSQASSKFYPFFNMPTDTQARIRFLPDVDTDNPLVFMVEKVYHNLTINGKYHPTPCLGKDCPICELSRQYYKDEGDDSENGKKFWKKRDYIAQVLVVEDPLPKDDESGTNFEGKVMPISFRWQLFNAIKSGIQKGGLDDFPYLFQGGCDFLINKTKNGKWDSYTTSMFARKATDLDTDLQAFCEENMVELATLLPEIPSLGKTQALLESALTGIDADDSDDSDDNPVVVKSKPEKKVEKKASKPAVTETDDEDEDDVDNVLAQLRNRRAAKES